MGNLWIHEKTFKKSPTKRKNSKGILIFDFFPLCGTFFESFSLSPKVPHSFVLIFCNKLDFQKAQRVPKPFSLARFCKRTKRFLENAGDRTHDRWGPPKPNGISRQQLIRRIKSVSSLVLKKKETKEKSLP